MFLSIEDAFVQGCRELRGRGIEVPPKHVATLAAYQVFARRAKLVRHDPRFPAEAPAFARRVILEALIVHAGGSPATVPAGGAA